MIQALAKLLGGNLGAITASGGGAGFWLPESGSTLAPSVDASWSLVYWISTFFFVLITFLVVFFVIRFRHREGHRAEETATHNTPLEVFWTAVPLAIVVVLFWQAYKAYLHMITPPDNAYEIQVTAQKWNWLFTYPNGYISPDLHVEQDTAIQLVMSSEDVLHSFFVPEFRVKQDVVPGRYTKVWFEATVPGEYDLFCTEYCGKDHSSMLAKVVVHERGMFDPWLAEVSDIFKDRSLPEVGELLYNQRGCRQCHSVDGSAGTGPTFLGVYGSTHGLMDGSSVTVDENYIRESILEPRAKITQGYDAVMPTYQGRLKDKEITAIVEYLKSLQ
jgi:cytochrome c oxidase subunit 2